MSSTVLYSFSADHFFSAEAVEVSQGFPGPYSKRRAEQAQLVVADTSVLPPSKRRKLTGNGMHLAACAGWHMWVMSHLVRREQPDIPAPIQNSEAAADDDIEFNVSSMDREC